MPPRLRVLDVFAGAGGLSEGLITTDSFEVVEAVESNTYAAATFAANHPDARVFSGSIEDWLTGDMPSVDVVAGGPPCQGFSNLGRRRVRDPRNALWRRYAEALSRTRPIYFIMENVADFLKSGQFRDLRRATHRDGPLSSYRLEFGVLNSAQFGAAQLRRRAVILGSHRDLSAPGLPIGHLGTPEQWVTVRQAIGDLPAAVERVDLPDRYTDLDGRRVPGGFKTDELHLGRRPTELSLERYRHIPPGGNRTDLPHALQAPCWRDHSRGSADVMGRLHWDRAAVTIRTEFWKPEKGRYLHPEADRAITHLEAARIQGFRDDYLWYGSKTEIGRQIGNAVPQALSRAIGTHIAQHRDAEL